MDVHNYETSLPDQNEILTHKQNYIFITITVMNVTCLCGY